jgi:hypothetical protein
VSTDRPAGSGRNSNTRPQTRVVVTLNTIDPEEGTFFSESVHEHNYSETPTGVLLDWGGQVSTLYPWQAVLKVDRDPCTCAHCKPKAAAA